MLRILDITAPDINNGNGLRVTLWVAGCKHHCKGCHNEWTWKFEQGRVYSDEKEKIKDELSKWLDKEYISGLTLSGGDPLCQDNDGLSELFDIIKWFREKYPQKTIWLYTGYTKEQIEKSDDYIKSQILNNVDVLVDGQYVKELRDIAHTPFRGSTNQRIIHLNSE